MESSSRTLGSNRYVIEDSIPKVTTDGQPHEVMTIVAMISGLIAAAVVLFILFSLIGNRRRTNEAEERPQSNALTKDTKSNLQIIPMFSTPKKLFDESEKNRPQLLSVSSISEYVANGEGHVNFGFHGCSRNPDCPLNSGALSSVTTVQC